MNKKLAGKVAVVTGASKGIGAGIALQLASDGASVVVNYSSSKESADKVVNEITQKGGKAIAVQGNMTQADDIEHLFSETIKAFGHLDILINNAGIYEFKSLEEITPEHFYKMYDLNVLGLLMATKEAVKHFGEKGGSIINIGSVAGTGKLANASVYSSTKAAVDAITRNLGQELGHRNIRVNSINPGLVETEGVHSIGYSEGEFRKNFEAKTPLERMGQPSDIAPAVSFLASDDASWISCETLYISGGNR